MQLGNNKRHLSHIQIKPTPRNHIRIINPIAKQRHMLIPTAYITHKASLQSCLSIITNLR